METIRILNGMSSVYGNVCAKQGPALIHWPEWAVSGDVVYLRAIVEGASLNPFGMCVRRIRVGGSDYQLFYKRDHRVECFTVKPLDSVSRPLSVGKGDLNVTYLHFYRPLSEKKWHQLRPGEDVKLPKVRAPEFAHAA